MDWSVLEVGNGPLPIPSYLDMPTTLHTTAHHIHVVGGYRQSSGLLVPTSKPFVLHKIQERKHTWISH